MTEAKPVITVTPTIMSGTVVCWYRNLAAANQHQPIVSASRDGVMIHGDQWLRDVEPFLEAASEAYRVLGPFPDADLRHLATHRSKGLMGPLEEVMPSDDG